ncbi:MAG: hypothetical protein ACFB0B_17860 [Thermonemataceae bacterium]
MNCQSQQSEQERENILEETSPSAEISASETAQERLYKRMSGKYTIYREFTYLGDEIPSSELKNKYLIVRDSIVTAYLDDKIRFRDTLKISYMIDKEDWYTPEFNAWQGIYIFTGNFHIYLGGMEGDLEEYTD